MNKIVPILMAGGTGSRLWPVSTPDLPKQFMPLKTGGTAFGNTLARVADSELFAPPVIICAEIHAALVKNICTDKNFHIICEPVGRNTAPAISIGTLAVLAQTDASSLVIVLPADHYIPDIGAFHDAVCHAKAMAMDGHIVTFGIKPEFAHTQYGYVEMGMDMGNGYRVESFTEKPDVDTAQSYLDCGRYLWNAGIFMARADVLMAEIQTFQPDIYLATKQAWESSRIDEQGIIHLDEPSFAQTPKISFDYAVMERTTKASVLAVDFLWRDLGGWDALMEFAI